MEIINDVNLTKNVKSKKKLINSKYYIPAIIVVFTIVMIISLLVNDLSIFKIEARMERLSGLETQLSTLRRQNEQRANRITVQNRSFYYEKLARSLGMKRRGEVIISLRNRKRFNVEANELISAYERKKTLKKLQIVKNLKLSRIATIIIFGLVLLYILYRFFTLRSGSIKIPDYFKNPTKEKSNEIGDLQIHFQQISDS